jgi:hypothetical protein
VRLAFLIPVLFAAISLGCAAKKPVGTNLLVAIPCLTKPVELIGCDLADPPKCRQAKVAYRKGCEQIEAKP